MNTFSCLIQNFAGNHDLSIVDSEADFDVTVRQSDVANAVPKCHRTCAFSLAYKRQYKGIVTESFFSRGVAYLQIGHNLVRFRTGEAITRELVCFDRHHVMAPGDYTLKQFSPSARLGVYRSHGAGGGHNPDAKKRHETLFVRTADNWKF